GPGYRRDFAPHHVSTGTLAPELSPFDAEFRQFMERQPIPGAAVAVTANGQLKYARGFGYADLANRIPVQPDNLFRIASVSKPITAVAILQLVEQGRLRLDEPVWEVLDFDAAIAAEPAFDKRQRDITIRRLLEHRGGWDRDESFDAMFQSVRFARELGVDPPAGPREVMLRMLAQPLDFDPGERYAYSNYGYCLLGRVIEQRSGLPYEEYVRQHILRPLGIETMRLGRTRAPGRSDHEVRYYHPRQDESVFADNLEQPVPSPYGGWYLEAMDSHGGWLASAVDLAKFAAAFDDPNASPLLSRQSIDQMYGRPPGQAGYNDAGEPKEVYYSLGWQNRVLGADRSNHWHNGSLPGTATILIRRSDGVNLIALLNTRVSPSVENLGRELDRTLHRAANAVQAWPAHDLFEELDGAEPHRSQSSPE
ncbi:MAG: beta-lactamase family protein, partial [Planctomycetaceae bacterium]|nr:beta-lactamase family protein [Planctomycetaceae bacterium]